MKSAGLILVVACAGSAGFAHAQGIEGQVGRFYEGEGWTLYRLGLSRPLVGPLGTTLHGDYMSRVGDAEGAFAGLGFDVTAFRGSGAGPYLVAGVGAGMGSPHSRSFSSTWTSWSAGLGYELAPASFLKVGFEGRWREISLDRRDGWELSAGLSIGLGGGRKPPSKTSPLPAAARSADEELPPLTTTLPATPHIEAPSAQLADSIIATATEVMGRPYKYGGTGEDGGGFDCSGLIQYAYARHGITLPRRSADQAREGRAVKKRSETLLPGDLLTFSNRGGPVTHVGLYIGDGRFIHSATRGVQVSTLSPDDPYGRWWYVRWVGVRRIVR
jgi:cell wall-associated NlpC family hydrolase/opacity protein-like surface antigen